MTMLVSIGKEDPIPGREEILAGKQEGWEIFCEFCVEWLIQILNEHNWYRKESTAKHIASEIITKVFLAFNRNPETLANMKTFGEIRGYLLTTMKSVRIERAKEQSKLNKKGVTPEELENPGIAASQRRELEEPDVVAYELKKEAPRLFTLDFERGLAARELLVQVKRAHERMPSKRGEILRKAMEGDSHKMIAQEFGVNEKTVGQELNRARRDLLKHVPENSISALEMFIPRQLRKLRGTHPQDE